MKLFCKRDPGRWDRLFCFRFLLELRRNSNGACFHFLFIHFFFKTNQTMAVIERTSHKTEVLYRAGLMEKCHGEKA